MALKYVVGVSKNGWDLFKGLGMQCKPVNELAYVCQRADYLISERT